MPFPWLAARRRRRPRAFRPRLELLERRDVPSNPTYQQLAGDPPLPTSTAWAAWESNLESQRLARVPQARAAHYYFAQNGDDLAGDGRPSHPFRSLAWAAGLAGAR